MDVLTLRGILTLDKSQYDKGLTDAGNSASSFGSKFKSGMKTLAKAGAVAFTASATALTALSKSAISAYADTEQLQGGVAKLYGNMGQSVEEYAETVGKSVDSVRKDWERNEKAQSIVMENAKNAFQTAGLSANQYMEQATSFSAALINSLNGDTVKAAKQTDVAMRAIADNYNTFGGDMQSIQYAFQGFAKQNYSMLDNLKLGYGGTKTEMERLIADANKWAEENGKAADLSIESFSDVVTAIDYIQQKQQIAGTTAREASSTIAGSFGMMKSAYENLVAGFADPNADISKLVSNLVSSIGTVGKNLLPAVKQMAKGLGQAMEELAPTIVEAIPKIMSESVPMLVSASSQLISILVQSIASSIPQLIKVGGDIMKNIASGVAKNAGTLINNGLQNLTKFTEFLKNSASTLIPVGLDIIKSLALGIIQNIPTLIQTVPVMIQNLANIINDNAPKVIEMGVSILKALVVGIIKAIPTLIASIPQIIRAFVATIKAFSWASLGRFAVNGIARGIRAVGGAIRSAASNLVSRFRAVVVAGFAAAKDKVVETIGRIKDGVKKKFEAVVSTVKGFIQKIKGMFPFSIGKIFTGLISLPSISVKKDKSGGASTSATTRHEHFAKAMNTPYMFTKPTIFDVKEAGEAGDEILYGRNALMGDIKKAVGDTRGVVINNSFNINGAENPNLITEQIVRSIELQLRTA